MRDWLNRGPLMDGAGDGNQGGGGSEGDKGAAFDAAKFKTELMADVTNMVNGSAKRIEKLFEKFKPAENHEGDKGGDDKSGEGDKGKSKDPELARALKQIETLTKTVTEEKTERAKATEQAREERRMAKISTELQKHGLADHAVDDAIRYFRDEVKYTESGELVGGADEVPLADFVKGTVEKRTHWLPPVPAGGAGASRGKGGKTAGIQIESINPTMTPDQRAQAWAEVNAVLKQQ